MNDKAFTRSASEMKHRSGETGTRDLLDRLNKYTKDVENGDRLPETQTKVVDDLSGAQEYKGGLTDQQKANLMADKANKR